MSDSLALQSSPVPGEKAPQTASRAGFGAFFAAVLESLVAAHRQRFDDETTPYRLPPV